MDLWGPLLPSVTTRLITSVVNAFPSFVKRYLNNSNTAVVQLKLLSASQPSSMRSMKLVNLRRPASSTFFSLYVNGRLERAGPLHVLVYFHC